MENKFIKLGITPSIIKAITDMGFITPTEVQSKAIPLGLKKEDLIVMSKTGSGKTAAFGIPMIQHINNMGTGPQGLILTPTRELAVQVDKDLKLLSKYRQITTTAIYGQHSMEKEIQDLKKGASIVTGTPGRVFDHIKKRTLITKNIKFLVLDEADRMLDMGFIDQVYKIVKTIPTQRVTMMFSATLPMEIQRLSRSYMNQPITIELESDTKTVDTTVQIYYRVQAKEKRTQLDRLLKVEQPEGCLIFCNTRYEVDRVHTFLSKKRYFVSSLHGANSQSSRMKTLDKIKRGVIQIVVATDVAARGLHIDNLGLVVNYDVPLEKDGYVHRIGRTGRAGEIGKAITLVTSEDIMTLYEIEEHIGVLIREEQLPSDAEVQKKISEATGKWANKKAPIQNHQIAKKYNQGTRKPHQHHINKSKRVQDRPAAKKQYQKNVVDRSSKTNIAAEKTHCVEKSAKKEYKPIINKRYNKNNAVYRVKTESTNRRKKEKMVKKNSLMKKIGNLMKGN